MYIGLSGNPRTCRYCGDKLKSYQNMYCSNDCCALNKNSRKGKTERPLTEDTRFIVHKWHMEGTRAVKIAVLLQRPPEQIEKILKMPLGKSALQTIKTYWISNKRTFAEGLEVYKNNVASEQQY